MGQQVICQAESLAECQIVAPCLEVSVVVGDRIEKLPLLLGNGMYKSLCFMQGSIGFQEGVHPAFLAEFLEIKV